MFFTTFAAPRRRPNRPEGATLAGATDRLRAALPPMLVLPFELLRPLAAAFFSAASSSLIVADAAAATEAFSARARSAPSTRWRFGGGGIAALSLGSSRQITRLPVLLRPTLSSPNAAIDFRFVPINGPAFTGDSGRLAE